jgi:hypothetical protein
METHFTSKTLCFLGFHIPFLTEHRCTIVRLYSCYVRSIELDRLLAAGDLNARAREAFLFRLAQLGGTRY